jgi:hypothetical protein
MKRLTLIIVIYLFLTFGCGFKDQYVNIPDNQKPIYKKGDFLIYKSKEGLLDTLNVGEYTDNYRVSDKSYHSERIRTDLYNQTEHFGVIVMELNLLEISWNGFDLVVYNLADNAAKKVVINNKQVENVFEFSPTSYYLSADTTNKIYYTYKYGVMKYENKSGEIWELINY